MRSRSPPPSGRGSGSGPSRARPDGGDEELVERRSRKRRPAGGCGSNPYPRRIRSDALPGGRRRFARLAGAAFDGWRFARVGRRDRILHGPQAVEHGRGNSRATRRRGVALHFLAGPVGQPGGATHAHPHGQVLPLDLAGGRGMNRRNERREDGASGRLRRSSHRPIRPPQVRAAIPKAARTSGSCRGPRGGGRCGRTAIHRPNTIGPMGTAPPGALVPFTPVDIRGGLVGRGLGRRGEQAPAPAVSKPDEGRLQPEHAARPFERMHGSATRFALASGLRGGAVTFHRARASAAWAAPG